jgi:DNA polymerase I
VLEELALVHELPREILEWRALQKLKGTYIDALPQLVNPKTGACTPASTRRWPPRGA